MSISRRAALATGAAFLALPSFARAQSFKGKTLTVASWQDYGADDPATLKMFEDMTGARIKNVYFTSEDDLLVMLREGGIGKIDVVLAQPRIREACGAAGAAPADRHGEGHVTLTSKRFGRRCLTLRRT